MANPFYCRELQTAMSVTLTPLSWALSARIRSLGTVGTLTLGVIPYYERLVMWEEALDRLHARLARGEECLCGGC